MTRHRAACWLQRKRITAATLCFVYTTVTGAYGHSDDLLLARVLQCSNAEVSVEITVEPSKNPFLRSSTNLAEALGEALEVHLPSGKHWLLRNICEARITLSDRFEHAAPVPVSHQITEAPKELLTAKWTWRPSESPLRFEVPNANPNTVLLWEVAADSELPLPGWRMLVSGDRSDPIHLRINPQPLQWNWKARAAITVAALGLALNFLLLIRKTKLKPPS